MDNCETCGHEEHADGPCKGENCDCGVAQEATE